MYSCRLVVETLDPLDGDRKCFRMVNGVLVERTVKDVLPTLKTNSDGLKQVIEDMLKQYKSKQNELDTWKVSISPGSWVLLYLKPYSAGLDINSADVDYPYRKRTISRSCSPRDLFPFFSIVYFDLSCSLMVLSECERTRLSALLGTAKD